MKIVRYVKLWYSTPMWHHAPEKKTIGAGMQSKKEDNRNRGRPCVCVCVCVFGGGGGGMGGIERI